MRVDGKFFARGNHRFPFRGVTYGTFRPREDGARFPERDRIKRDFASMREAGFTVVRTYTEPPPDLLELAADWGLHVFAGVFWKDWRYLVGASARQRRAMAAEARREVREAVRRLAGCEQVLAVSLGNEVPADAVRWVGEGRVAAVISQLADAARAEDPERLVTYANYPSAEYLQLDCLDFLTFNVFLERKADLRRYLSRLHHLAGDRPVVLGELGCDAGRGPARGRGEAAQAAALDWQLETAIERGVAGTCVFSWTDEWWVGDAAVEGWHFGLTRANRSPRPALDVARVWNSRTVADFTPSSGWPSMSVVICAYNAADTLDECLLHACALDYPALEVIVVDDGSTDATAEIAGWHARTRLVRIAHGGLSVARNAGCRTARGEIVAYLDADAYPALEWPYYLALGFDSRFVGGVGGPNLPPPSDPLTAQEVARAPGGPVHVLTSDDRAEHVPGCNMAFWKGLLEEVGGFAPIYTSAGDDVDLCWKMLDRGWEIGFHPAAVVWHHRRGSRRAYLRQQRGYGRAEALVAARHPDRFTTVGTARWRGRIYNSLLPQAGRQRIYRGTFGTAAYQSVYGGGGSGLDLAHQLGVPVAAGLLVTAPLGLVSGLLALPALAALVVVLVLLAIDIARAAPPRDLRERRASFRLAVASLCLLQPLVRAWGRMGSASAARRDLPGEPTLEGPAQSGPGGTIVLPSTGPREQTTAAVVDVVHRTGVRVVPPTGWEGRDVGLIGSLLVNADLVTTGHCEGAVQVRTRQRLRPGATALAAALAVVAAFVSSTLALSVVAIALGEAARGAWRTGPQLRRAVRKAARSQT